jgi:RNA polymerase sigma-70 factor (ECF subfamily)
MHTGGRREDGRIRSFEELYRNYYGRVVAYFRHLGVPSDEARDFAQDVFFRVFQHMDTYRGESEWNFIEITARRYFANMIRAKNAKKRDVFFSPIDDVASEVRDTALAADAAIELRETAAGRKREFVHALAELGPATREAFLLRLKGIKYKDVAKILGISLDAARARIHEARVRLTDRFGADAAGEDDHDEE